MGTEAFSRPSSIRDRRHWMIIRETARRKLSVDDRKGIIGGSSVGALLELGGYSSLFQVYMDYTGQGLEPDEQTKWTFRRGHIMEKAIAEMFSALTGFELTEPEEAYYDPDHPYLILHPDREFTDPKSGRKYALECKMASMHAFRHSWGDPGEEIDAPLIDPSVPVYKGDEKTLVEQYYAQVQWYYALADYEGVFLARMTDGDIAIYYVEPDEMVQRALYKTAIRFHDRVAAGWKPDPKTTFQAKAAHPESIEGSEISADMDIESKMERIRTIRDEIRELDAEEEILKTEIMEYMKDSEILNSRNGSKLATWKKVNQTSFDSRRFKQDYPSLYETYLVRKETRAFRLSGQSA